MNMRKVYAKLAELCDRGHNYFTDKAAHGLFKEWESSRRPGAYVADAKLPVDSGDMGQLKLALKDNEVRDAMVKGYLVDKKKVAAVSSEYENWKGANWNEGNPSHDGEDD